MAVHIPPRNEKPSLRIVLDIVRGTSRSTAAAYGLSSLAVTAISAVVASCHSARDINHVTVSATEYAFATPPAMHPGRTAFSFQNRGDVKHKLILVRLKEGATLQQFLDSAQSGGNLDSVVDGTVGILLANPGQGSDGKLLVDLMPRRVYAMVCTFRDASHKPSHVALGMVTSFRTE